MRKGFLSLSERRFLGHFLVHSQVVLDLTVQQFVLFVDCEQWGTLFPVGCLQGSCCRAGQHQRGGMHRTRQWCEWFRIGEGILGILPGEVIETVDVRRDERTAVGGGVVAQTGSSADAVIGGGVEGEAALLALDLGFRVQLLLVDSS